MKKFTCLLIVFLSGFFAANAQTFSVSGSVVDENNVPLLGVNVIVKGESRGTTTDFDGNYTVDDISPGDVLQFSYIGFVAQEVTVSNDQTINVQLITDSEALDEVVVVGYGTQRKSNVVGSVSSVEVDEATAIPTTNVSEMLRGRAAGVQVNLGSARPGGGSDITIRGNVSVAPGGNSPLIIVDGLPFDSLNDVAPDDIANIEILKDAASTAIYGSRASNGVILVTTKKGAEGITRINYNAYTTVQSLTKNFNLYDGSQFVDLRREANRNRFTGNYLRDENIFSPFELETI
ncbi:MAG: TonB-dependent receptor plug domain-containing protein, partial [Gramella sp.]|nr:TonB-dependent receptor plug domain-containing protein [Christiangramia sp.]